jgi:hypothetical protein
MPGIAARPVVARSAALAAIGLAAGCLLTASPANAAEHVDWVEIGSSTGESWVVPPGVHEISAHVGGGDGGAGGASRADAVPSPGGEGSAIIAYVPVVPGQELVFTTGEAGGDAADAAPGIGGDGWRAGGDGGQNGPADQRDPALRGNSGGGGGGATALTVREVDGSETVLVVIGGGGGGGGDGAGGDSQAGTDFRCAGGAGGRFLPGSAGQCNGAGGGGRSGELEGQPGGAGASASGSDDGAGGGGGGGGWTSGRGGGSSVFDDAPGGGGGGGGGGGYLFTASGVGYVAGDQGPSAGYALLSYDIELQTEITVASSANPSAIGTPPTFEVAVANTETDDIPAGTVLILASESELLATAVLDADGTARFTESFLNAVGTHELIFFYRPADGEPFATSVTTFTQTVEPAAVVPSTPAAPTSTPAPNAAGTPHELAETGSNLIVPGVLLAGLSMIVGAIAISRTARSNPSR